MKDNFEYDDRTFFFPRVEDILRKYMHGSSKKIARLTAHWINDWNMMAWPKIMKMDDDALEDEILEDWDDLCTYAEMYIDD